MCNNASEREYQGRNWLHFPQGSKPWEAPKIHSELKILRFIMRVWRRQKSWRGRAARLRKKRSVEDEGRPLGKEKNIDGCRMAW
jgi:hypothetical protein